MERESDHKIHVVLLPWLAFGHMMPFHQLAIALAKAGVYVSYISTPKNIQRLPKPSPTLSPLIDFVPLPLPVLPSNPLPEGSEATVDISGDQFGSLAMAFDLLKQPFKQFVSNHSPNYIIIDFLPHWATDVARDCRIPLLTFSAFSAATNVFFGPPEYLAGDGQKRDRSTIESLTCKPKWVSFPSKVFYRKFEAMGALVGFYGSHGGAISGSQRVAKAIMGSEAVVIRSCREIEGEYLSLFEKLIGKPVIPVGLLPPEKPKQIRETDNDHDGSWTQTFKWLDEQKPKSVLFVGFGSECKLSKQEIHEIAYGIEASGLPFLWALRKPNWATSTDDDDILPVGFFSEKNMNKGLVCFGWAPQMEILAHKSIGASLFHGGWGSAIETLQFGHSLIALPLIIDQGLNARLLVEKGLAIEVERREDGSFSRDDIAKCLRKAMTESKEGEEMRGRLGEVAAMAGDRKLQDRYVDEFVEYLKNGLLIREKK